MVNLRDVWNGGDGGLGSQADDNPYYGHVVGASDSRHSSHSKFPHKNQLLDPSVATSRN